MENTYKNVEDSEYRINAQTCKLEVMFNQINSNMNKFIDLSTKINDLNKRLSEMEGTVNKINGSLPLFATKDDIVGMQNKLYSQDAKK